VSYVFPSIRCVTVPLRYPLRPVIHKLFVSHPSKKERKKVTDKVSSNFSVPASLMIMCSDHASVSKFLR